MVKNLTESFSEKNNDKHLTPHSDTQTQTDTHTKQIHIIKLHYNLTFD